MDIPIQNLYYLLCYAWNKLDERDRVNVDALDSTELLDLFAKILIRGTTRLLKQGLDRDYIDHEDVVNGVKGKLLLTSSIKRNTLRQLRTICIYDEFEANILHNQILKTTLYRLTRVSKLDKGLREDIQQLLIKLPRISIIKLRAAHFETLRLNKNNYHYDFILKVCRIIYESVLIDESTGEYLFQDFVRDDKAMARLFEAFIRNFYAFEQTHYTVKRQQIDWQMIPEPGADTSLLPIMETDISLVSPQRKIIIDAKFYREAFQARYTRPKFASGNLYQIFAYLKNQEDDSLVSQTCEGMLLYPAVYENFRHSFMHGDHRITIQSLNLNQPWQDIHRDLFDLLI